ncbi:MAG: 16S rRNA (cytidine(1402)-2'-O)-methyltransferase [Pyrinomonadaceae bacterium]
MPGTLYLVATPIGNLQDITLRALETLRSVDLIACEDTRHTRNLLNHYRISNRTISYHEHNENERAEEFVEKLKSGESIAIVSDAGTPGICDPGHQIVRRAVESGIPVVPIPGAAAFVSALVVSGLSTESVFFGGFLPSKKGERRKRLERVRDTPATLIFYEAPHRLAKSLGDCREILGDRLAVVARELTKLHEEIARGHLSDLTKQFSESPVKGEIVIVIEQGEVKPVNRTEPIKNLAARVAELEGDGFDPKTALKKAAKEFGLAKSEGYRILQLEKDRVPNN